MSPRRTICLMTADVSGDQNAAGLATALRARHPSLRLLGVGGLAMREAGVDVRVESTDLSFMGVFDTARVLRQLVRCFRGSLALVRRERPDLVVLVDSEAAAMPMAAWLRRRGIPTVFYFPPQVWLWGRWRLPAMLPLARRFVCAFRPEAEMYAAAGADAPWTGHPLCDRVHVQEDTDAALRAIGLDPQRPLVVLMPGSRRAEVDRLLPPLLGAAEILAWRDPNLQFAIPAASPGLRAAIERGVAARRLAGRVVVYPQRSYAVLSRAKVVLQCSGTATLEVALLGIPAVIFYRCNPFEHFVASRLLIDAPFIGMVNILLGEMVQPEFFQHDVDAEHLAAAAWSLLSDDIRRRTIQRKLAELPALLGTPGAFDRAACAVLAALPGSSGEASPSAPALEPQPWLRTDRAVSP
jgi:lipid-A-disaccharide synthase